MVRSAFSTVLDSGRRPQHSATKNHDLTIRVCREGYRGLVTQVLRVFIYKWFNIYIIICSRGCWS